MSDSGEDLIRALIQALRDQTTAIQDQARAIDELVASNDKLLVALVEKHDESEGEAIAYMDGSPIR